ncbi:hypothetical protein ACQEVG_31610 [Streptomyces sp. CA-135486]|uniref:hypothetical protein n=1 Tax=Streptomyces sp. CA-135486 TaxID=3240049 RepID=UPI003D8F6C16
MSPTPPLPDTARAERGALAVRVVVAFMAALAVWAGVAVTPTYAAPRRSVTVTLRTTPVLAGVRFVFDGRVLTTDARGITSYTGSHDFEPHRLELGSTSLTTGTARYRFERWAGQRDPDQAYRRVVGGLPLRADYTVTAAFTAGFQVVLRCVDQQGRPVDGGRITSMTVRSDTGHLQEVPVGRPVWLAGLLVVYRRSQLTTRQLTYSVQTAMSAGTNTVDAGRQRFTPARSAEVVVTTPFHDLTVTARDAVFAGPAGSAVKVTLPDGSVRTAPFGADHRATIGRLPRGPYQVGILGASGQAATQQVRLSRSQKVELRVVSRLDLATAAGGALLMAAALLLAGRLLRRRERRAE